MSTLRYLINVQHVLLIFQKIPTYMVLLHPARFINFWKFSSLHVLMHPAHGFIFQFIALFIGSLTLKIKIIRKWSFKTLKILMLKAITSFGWLPFMLHFLNFLMICKPACLLHPACFIDFEKIASLHVYYILHDY